MTEVSWRANHIQYKTEKNPIILKAENEDKHFQLPREYCQSQQYEKHINYEWLA